METSILDLATVQLEYSGKADHGTDAQEYVFLASVGTPDRNENVYDIAGWELDNYHKNPVVITDHDHRRPPVGSGRVWIDGDRMMAGVVFANTPRANEYRALVDQGYLRGISVGHLPKDWEFRRLGPAGPIIGIHSHRQELVELSLVTIPAQPDALRTAALATLNHTEAVLSDLIHSLRQELRKLKELP